MRTRDQKNELMSTIQELYHDQFNIKTIIIWILAYQGIEGNEKSQYLLLRTNTFHSLVKIR